MKRARRRPRQPTPAERAAWFDHIAVERALDDWAIGEPLTSVGRPLSRRERAVVTCALAALGLTCNEITTHLRMRASLTGELLQPPPPGELRDEHDAQVAAAVAHLRRLDAPRKVETRRHPLTSSEVDRIVALAVGTGDMGHAALFDAAIA